MAGIDENPGLYRWDFEGYEDRRKWSTSERWQSKNGKYRKQSSPVSDPTLIEKGHELAIVKERIKRLIKLEQELKNEIMEKLPSQSYLELSSPELEYNYIIERSSSYNTSKYNMRRVMRHIYSRHGKKECELIRDTCKVNGHSKVSIYVRPFPKEED